MNKIILGFTWEMWCGKDTAAEFIFDKFWWQKFKFSSSLRDVLDRIYVEKTRNNLASLSTELRSLYGQDILAKIMYHDVLESTETMILIDWVRRNDDIIYLTKLPEFKLIYIETSLENRFERINIRWENVDDIGKTIEQFKKEQMHEAEVQIRWLKDTANFVIDNNWTKDEFYSQIEEIVSQLR